MINIGQLMNMAKNPQQMIQNMMQDNSVLQNPIMRNGIEMYKSGNADGLQSLVNNMCKEKGTTVNEIRSKLGF